MGATSIGGAFYAGTNWPAQYHGRYFFADYTEDWLKVMTTDSLDQLVAVEDFGWGLEGAAEFVPDPFTGDFYYASLWTGEVRRLRLGDLNLGARRVRIEQSKGLKDRLVCLSTAIVEALQAYLGVEPACKQRATSARIATGWPSSV